MILARRRLRIHHRHHRRSLAEFPGEVARAFADVVVDAVDTGSAVLTHVILAVVDVLGAVNAAESGRALACVMREVIDALGTVQARVEFRAAELNFLLAKLAVEARQATACIRLNSVDTCSVVLALVVIAVVNIDFAASAVVAGQAFATEPAFLQHRACSIVAARISVASVNHMLAVLAMIARGAPALVLFLGLHHALGVVLARECVASIAFRQNLITDFLFADELVGRRGQNEFVFHPFRLGAPSDAWLHVIQFHPLREPFQRTIAVQWIATQSAVNENAIMKRKSISYYRKRDMLVRTDFGELGNEILVSKGCENEIQQKFCNICFYNKSLNFTV